MTACVVVLVLLACCCSMEEKCYEPCHADDITGSGASTLELYQMADIYLHKMLVRNENWVPCTTKDCGFGFLGMLVNIGERCGWRFDSLLAVFCVRIVEGKVGTKLEGMVCGVCYAKQTVEKKEVGLDEEFKKLVKEVNLCSPLSFETQPLIACVLVVSQGKMKGCPVCKMWPPRR